MERRYLVSDMTLEEFCAFLSDFDHRFYEIVVVTVSPPNVTSARPIVDQRFTVEYRGSISGFERECLSIE